jgi:hypothetical protein
MHPLFLTIGNIQSDVRMKAASHAWRCMAFIPMPTFLVNSDYQTLLQSRLWHKCVDSGYNVILMQKNRLIIRYSWCINIGKYGHALPLRYTWPHLDNDALLVHYRCINDVVALTFNSGTWKLKCFLFLPASRSVPSISLGLLNSAGSQGHPDIWGLPHPNFVGTCRCGITAVERLRLFSCTTPYILSLVPTTLFLHSHPGPIFYLHGFKLCHDSIVIVPWSLHSILQFRHSYFSFHPRRRY